ncbi:MAG: ATP-binding cassette domain-containing protein, partial [Myxococcales bacterium]|nr:ATP-binding cassette domain-containing protein [Myxococcales bacterium]
MSAPHTPYQSLRRLLRYASEYSRRIKLAATCSVLNKLFDLAPPALIGAAVDVVVKQDESLIAKLGVTSIMGQLWILAGLTILIWALESTFEYIATVMWRNLAQDLQHGVRLDAYVHVQDMDMARLEDESTGGLMSVLNDDINQLERFLDGGADNLIQVTTTVVLIGIAFFYFSPVIAVLSFVPVPVVLWGSFRFQNRIAPRYGVVRERVGILNGQLSNNLHGIATIKSFATERFEEGRIRRESKAYVDANREAIRLSSAFSPLIRMVIVCGFTATLVYGGHQVDQGTLEVGSYSVLVFLTQRLLWPLTRLGETFDLYQRAMASTDRVLNLLAVPNQIRDGSKAISPAEVRGEIRFQDIRFVYPNGTRVVDGLSLTMPAGQTTAIVGSTGSGKSTLVKLLLRFYDPQSGQVTLDGIRLD